MHVTGTSGIGPRDRDCPNSESHFTGSRKRKLGVMSHVLVDKPTPGCMYLFLELCGNLLAGSTLRTQKIKTTLHAPLHYPSRQTRHSRLPRRAVHAVPHDMMQLSGTLGMPSSPISIPGGRGPIISGGGEPYVCICKSGIMVGFFQRDTDTKRLTSFMSVTIFTPFS